MIRKKYIDTLKILKDTSPINYYDNVQLSDMSKKSRIGKKFNICDSYDLFKPDNKRIYSILNTDNSKKPGTHWVAVIQDKHMIYVYDSFARTGKYLMKPFINKMKEQGFDVIFINNGSDQANDAVDCGIRCFLYLIFVDRYGLDKCQNI